MPNISKYVTQWIKIIHPRPGARVYNVYSLRYIFWKYSAPSLSISIIFVTRVMYFFYYIPFIRIKLFWNNYVVMGDIMTCCIFFSNNNCDVINKHNKYQIKERQTTILSKHLLKLSYFIIKTLKTLFKRFYDAEHL